MAIFSSKLKLGELGISIDAAEPVGTQRLARDEEEGLLVGGHYLACYSWTYLTGFGVRTIVRRCPVVMHGSGRTLTTG